MREVRSPGSQAHKRKETDHERPEDAGARHRNASKKRRAARREPAAPEEEETAEEAEDAEEAVHDELLPTETEEPEEPRSSNLTQQRKKSKTRQSVTVNTISEDEESEEAEDMELSRRQKQLKMVMQMIPKNLHINNFDGTEKTLQPYISSLKTVFTTCIITQTWIKLHLARTFVEGDFARSWMEMNIERFKTFEQLEAELADQFTLGDKRMEVTKEIREIRQRNEEAPIEYAQRFQKLLARVQVHLQGLPDSFLLLVLREGCHPKIHDLIQWSTVTSTHAAITKISQLKVSMNSQKGHAFTPGKPRYDFANDQKKQQGFSAKPAQAANPTKQHDKPDQARQTWQKQPPNGKSDRPAQAETAKQPTSSIKCYACQKHGHLARDCPQKSTE